MIRDYLVWSPEHMVHPGDAYGSMPEPPEYGAAAATVKASTAKEAIKIAMKLPDFRRWIQDARSDCKNPYTGIRARRLDWIAEKGMD